MEGPKCVSGGSRGGGEFVCCSVVEPVVEVQAEDSIPKSGQTGAQVSKPRTAEDVEVVEAAEEVEDVLVQRPRTRGFQKLWLVGL